MDGCGPELALMVGEFQGNISSGEDITTNRNVASKMHLLKLQKVLLFPSFEEIGNLFIDEGLQLLLIHTKDVMDMAVVNSPPAECAKDWKGRGAIQKICQGAIR